MGERERERGREGERERGREGEREKGEEGRGEGWRGERWRGEEGRGQIGEGGAGKERSTYNKQIGCSLSRALDCTHCSYSENKAKHDNQVVLHHPETIKKRKGWGRYCSFGSSGVDRKKSFLRLVFTIMPSHYLLFSIHNPILFSHH